MGLMEPGCKLEDFGRLAQPAATNRLRCRVNVVSERYLVGNASFGTVWSEVFGLCMVTHIFLKQFCFIFFVVFF